VVVVKVNGYTIKPGAGLEGANLSGANLGGANLGGAYLKGANLKGVDATGTIASEGTDWPEGFDSDVGEDRPLFDRWTGQIVSDAAERRTRRLIDRLADNPEANLEGANLKGAYLEREELKGANLKGANLTGAGANDETAWPEGYDAVAAGVIIY
jgi:uncharacterized protein YjbI with pentapeptide repeats